MDDRITQKIQEIEQFMSEIEPILPSSLEEYLQDYKIRAICERYCEKIIEAVVDLAFMIIKNKKLKNPDTEQQAFDILRQHGIISEKLALNLKAAKGMRNIIAHEYGKIDDELIYEAITQQLLNDVREFLEAIPASEF